MSAPHPEEATGGVFYRRLEVGPDASHDEIVRAYRRLALGVHPDAHPEDPQATRRFQEITEAYEVLTDPSRRAAYDRTNPSRRIPVRRRPRTNETAETGKTREQIPPIFLGTSGLQPMGDAPLRAGPVVHVESPSGSDEPRPAIADLLVDILDSRWRR